MATSKKEPLSTGRGRATTRMSPNLRPTSSESSGLGGYGPRRARSVPSSPDRVFGSSSPSPAPAGGSSNANRQSLSSAGRSVTSRTMSTSGWSSGRAQLFPGSASKPMLARAKSDKISLTSHRPPALAVLPSNSFKDTSKTAPKASPSSLLRNKLSPKPCADGCKATSSPRPSGQRMASQGEGAARGGRVQPVSTTRSPGVAAKKRLDGATVSSKAKGVSPRAPAAPVTRTEKEEDASMQFKKTESFTSTPATEEEEDASMHEHLSDPVDLKPTDAAVSDRCEPSSNQPEQQVKDGEEVKVHSCEGNDAGGNELHNGGQDANSGINKIVDESGHTEEEVNGILDTAVPPPNMTVMDQMWKKDDPKGNDAIEEAKRKLMEERKSRVKALVGAFERVMSFKE